MTMNSLVVKQLDKRFSKLKIMLNYPPPKNGWIRTIRIALRMPYRILAKKLKLSVPTIANLEKREVEGSITLNSLSKVAEAMDCKFVYAIVPYESLEKMIDNQIEKVVDKMIEEVNQTMKLEAQGTSKKALENERKRIKFELKENLKSKIWDYEI